MPLHGHELSPELLPAQAGLGRVVDESKPDFVGRGDMSRGALLLRAAREQTELPYEPAATAVRRGPRPRKTGASGEPKADPDTGSR